MWPHSKAFVGNMTQSQGSLTAGSDSRLHFPKTHPQPQQRNNSFSGLQPQLLRELLFPAAVNLEAPLSFFTGYHFMIIYLRRHLPGYCIYSVLALLPGRCVLQTLSYSLLLYFSEKTPDLLKTFHWITSQRPTHCLALSN